MGHVQVNSANDRGSQVLRVAGYRKAGCLGKLSALLLLLEAYEAAEHELAAGGKYGGTHLLEEEGSGPLVFCEASESERERLKGGG